MARTHLFTQKAERDLGQARKRLSMARESLAIAQRNVVIYEQEVRDAEYCLSLEREADART